MSSPSEPAVISLFAGCGGSSLGYRMAGFRELLAVEWDDGAVETFRVNFPDVPVYHGDIAGLSVDRCLETASLAPGELDLLDGSPPCQGFSTAGKRRFSDGRNRLFEEYVRLLSGLKPKAFVMENVAGMVRGKMRLVFAEVLAELKGSGYKVSCRLMNSKYYGVPQARQRLIIIGVHDDLGPQPSHPRPQTSPVTVREALQGVKPNLMAPQPRGAEAVFPCIRQGSSAIQSVPRSVLLQYVPRMANNRKFSFGAICKRLRWDQPAGTITRTFIPYSEPFIHPEEHRYLSIEELAALQSFPPTFRFPDDYKVAYGLIGNSVPPLLAKAIAEHIKKVVLDGTT